MAASACCPPWSAWLSSSSSSSETFISQGPRHVLLLPQQQQQQLCRFRHASSFLRPACARSMASPSSPSDLEDIIKSKNSENAIVVYSKSWCPYCLRVKSLFKEVRTKPYVVELDELADEEEVQEALQRITGQSTVPNVFIGGKHVGGCDDTLRLHHYKKLIPLLKEANAEFL